MLKIFASLGTRDKVYLGVAAPLVLLVTMGCVGILTVNMITVTNERLEHVEDVLKGAADVSASAVDMQTGMRGYLLAGQEEFLEPYKRGSATTFEKIDALSERVVDNTAQVNRLAKAKQVLLDWQQQVVEPAILLRREIGDADTMNDMAKLVAEGDGKEYFDRFRKQIGELISSQRDMLAERRREFSEARDAIGTGLNTLTQTDRAFQSSLSVISGAYSVLTHVVDMESGIRNFLLLGEPQLLQPFNDGRKGFFDTLAELKTDSSDDPDQRQRLERVEAQMQQWIRQVAEPIVSQPGRGGDNGRTNRYTDAFVSGRQDRPAIDDVRAEISEFIDVERAMMIERRNEAAQNETIISRAVATMYRNEETVSETHWAIAATDELIQSAIDMQTGMRGYLLTGREEYLQPYNAGSEAFEGSIEVLIGILGNNLGEVTMLSQAHNTIREWQLKVVKPQIDLRRNIGHAKTMDDMADLVADRQGKRFFDRFRKLISDFVAAGEAVAEAYRVETAETVAFSRYALTGLALLAVIVGLFLAWATGNGIARPLIAMRNVTGRLAGGDMEITIPGGERGDEIGEMAQALEQIRSVGVKAAQTQSSLNDASSAMMIVDLRGCVIFANKAMLALYADIAADLAGELAGFACETVIEAEFDTLHNQVDLQTGKLMQAEEPVNVRMRAGGHTLELTASPVYNDVRERLGVVIEWEKLTAQVAVEGEIAGIVRQATEGDFSARLSETDKNGFMAELANGVNELLDVVENGLDQVVRVVSALSDGDLTMRMKGQHAGAFVRLKDDVDRMAGQMEDMLGRISQVSDAVKGATDEISAGITDLSSRTEHQASSLEETTASMEQLSVTVRQNADNAQEATQVAVAAQDAAITGGAVTERAVAAMGRIEDSSNKITEIVGLMQEIAFQTNLLALNASVEAARAGDAGRGFSVVANEVRALSQRSAQASKDIRELINNSDNQVKEGVKLVGEAGAALDEIVNSAKSVAEHVSEIATASREQTGGIEQVSTAITGMDEMTQQNASLVEEANASIQSAMAQVAALQIAVGFFKTSQEPADGSENSDAGADPRIESDGTKLRELAREMGAPQNRDEQSFAKASIGGYRATRPTDGDGWEEF